MCLWSSPCGLSRVVPCFTVAHTALAWCTGELITPASFNTWLENNKGYLCLAGDCNNLRLDAPGELTSQVKLIGEAAKPALADMQAVSSVPGVLPTRLNHGTSFTLYRLSWEETPFTLHMFMIMDTSCW